MEDPFQNSDKSSVLQETRLFNETPIDHKKCVKKLTKILYLLNQGETLTSQEAKNVFFDTTKLFQSSDVTLRRMVYLCIKELSNMVDDAIIVTASLMKDMNEDSYKTQAIRAICGITDSTMLQSIERTMKQAIVDKNHAVNSAALVSALHLASTSPNLVRAWANECQEGISSDNMMVSYHSLGVVAACRKNDKLATAKLVKIYAEYTLKSPYALCLLIRLAAQLVDDSNDNPYIEFIDSCLNHKSEMVSYEAAYAIVNVKETIQDLAPIVSVMKSFCISSNAFLRLAGCRIFARLIEKHPTEVCPGHLQKLISDENSSVAIIALTTLLATCTENSVERLLKQVTDFLSHISEDLKIVVVRAIGKLCTKFPHKPCLIAFIANMLRDEGGLEYKQAVVDAIIAVIEENPGAKEIGLDYLCEFIEDCEHVSLTVNVLHILGREGPTSCQPTQYIRFIYNRIMLDSSPIRAAAVSTFAQFGARNPEVLPNILDLLERCKMDYNGEVRDRAIYYLAILDTKDKQLIRDYIINIPTANFMLLENAKRVRDYLARRLGVYDSVCVPSEMPRENIIDNKPVTSRVVQNVNLANIPEIKTFGPVLKTNEPVDVTDADSEFKVSCIQHVFKRHLVLRFECINTVPDLILNDSYVALEHTDAFTHVSKTVCPKLEYNEPGEMFSVLQMSENDIDSQTIHATMHFSVRDFDPTRGETNEAYQDTYPLGEIEFKSDHQ